MMKILLLLTVAALAAAELSTVKDKTTAERVTEVKEFSEVAVEEAASNTDPVVTHLINKLTCMKKKMKVVRVCNQMLETVSDCTAFTTYKDCKEAYTQGHRKSGVYTLNPDGKGKFQAYCNMESDGGGWTVFQRRMDGSVDFYRNWNDYVTGFGNPNGEYWLGLEKIYRLTAAAGRTTLRVDLGDFGGNKVYAKYSSFKVGNSASKYTLHVSGYSGNAKDSLYYHNGMKFTTKDHDNDGSNSNCAVHYKGAWWYKNCYYSSLNGLYSKTKRVGGQYLNWHGWKNSHEALKFDEMKLRRQ